MVIALRRRMAEIFILYVSAVPAVGRDASQKTNTALSVSLVPPTQTKPATPPIKNSQFHFSYINVIHRS